MPRHVVTLIERTIEPQKKISHRIIRVNAIEGEAPVCRGECILAFDPPHKHRAGLQDVTPLTLLKSSAMVWAPSLALKGNPPATSIPAQPPAMLTVGICRRSPVRACGNG